jgi:hypothetical protein
MARLNETPHPHCWVGAARLWPFGALLFVRVFLGIPDPEKAGGKGRLQSRFATERSLRSDTQFR